jgi:hypothetical protein
MKKKCSKYEALFVFGNEAALKEHLETCADCRAEQEMMDKVSALIKEARFKPASKLKAACILAAILIAGISFNLPGNQTLSAEDLGFPVDSYGLIMVD